MSDDASMMMSAMSHLKPGAMVSHFELTRYLGNGAMGVVFEAKDVVLERKVAIKFIYLSTPAMRARQVQQAIMKRFVREARLMARVSHASVVAIHEASFEGTEPYIVMEYIDGETLADCMQRAPLSAVESVEIAWQTASALQAAWTSHQLIHRDLKPGNMMLTRDGAVKILDLGLAKALSDEGAQANLTVTGMVMGTPYYMSPEQHMGSKGVDHRTDIFALGTILYQMLAGVVPWEGGNDFIIYQSKQTGARRTLMSRTDLPKRLVDLTYAMLHADRVARVGDYADILTGLEKSLYELRGGAGRPLIGATSAPRVPSELNGPTRVISGLAREQRDVNPEPSSPAQMPAQTLILADLAGEQKARGARQLAAPSILPGALARGADGELHETSRQIVHLEDVSDLGADPPRPPPAAPREAPADSSQLRSRDQRPATTPRPSLRLGGAASDGIHRTPQDLLKTYPRGSRVDGYTIGDLIGVGGVGCVYRATDPAGDPVALKLFVNQNDTGSPITLQSVRAVARDIQRLDHDAIVGVRTIGEADGTVYQALDLFLGPEDKPVDLVEYCRTFGDNGLADPEEFGPIIRHLVGALDYAHRHGVPHGNLKPQNILLSLVSQDDGYWQAELKITDFGVGRLVGEAYVLHSATHSLSAVQRGESKTASMDALLTTYDYMAPEQRRGEPAGVASDIYTVGLLALRLLTGHQHLERRTLPSQMRRGLAKAWDDVLLTALKERPAERFASAAHLLHALPP